MAEPLFGALVAALPWPDTLTCRRAADVADRVLVWSGVHGHRYREALAGPVLVAAIKVGNASALRTCVAPL
jgi:hypothetical protein